MECAILDCGRRVKARGWCSSHLEKWRRYGDPEHVPPRTARLHARIAAGEKACRRCGEVKPFEGFAPDPHRADGFRDECRPCGHLAVREWASRNREKVRQSVSARRAAWPPERRAAANAANAEWKRANPEKVRDYIHRRRAAKAGTQSGPIDLDALWAECSGLCPDCGAPISRAAPWGSPEFASLDHIVPLSAGGPHMQHNLRYTCLPCNLRKHAKVPAQDFRVLSRSGNAPR